MFQFFALKYNVLSLCPSLLRVKLKFRGKGKVFVMKWIYKYLYQNVMLLYGCEGNTLLLYLMQNCIICNHALCHHDVIMIYIIWNLKILPFFLLEMVFFSDIRFTTILINYLFNFNYIPTSIYIRFWTPRHSAVGTIFSM